MARRSLRRLLAIVYAFSCKVSWRRLIANYDRNSRNVVWVSPGFPSRVVRYLAKPHFLEDLALVVGASQHASGFRVVVGRRIGRVKNSRILYHPSVESMNLFNVSEYPHFLAELAATLERQGNELLLSSHEIRFWENKAHMHTQFERAGISQPATVIARPDELTECSLQSYPLLVKEVHSQSSRGVHLVASADELIEVGRLLSQRGESEIIVQELIHDMRRDLRVTVVGEEVVFAYWRINDSDTWRPTATRYGSRLKFAPPPKQWEKLFVKTTKDLRLRAAAYDVCWRGDDLSTHPVFLEVSPLFDPNPAPPARFQGQPYRAYKETILARRPYYAGLIDRYFDIAARKAALLFGTAVRDGNSSAQRALNETPTPSAPSSVRSRTS